MRCSPFRKARECRRFLELIDGVVLHSGNRDEKNARPTSARRANDRWGGKSTSG